VVNNFFVFFTQSAFTFSFFQNFQLEYFIIIIIIIIIIIKENKPSERVKYEFLSLSFYARALSTRQTIVRKVKNLTSYGGAIFSTRRIGCSFSC
jgi:hypothetical protein